MLSLDDCSEVCPNGLLVLRRQVSVIEPLDAQLEAVSTGWDISDWTRLRLVLRCSREGVPRARYPAVVSVGGYVATGAAWFLLGEPRSITGVNGRGEGLCHVGESEA